MLPAALPGVVGGILLAVSRAIGETMIVVMAAGLAANLTLNPFESVTTVTTQIVQLLTGDQEFDSAKTLAAFALGLTSEDILNTFYNRVTYVRGKNGWQIPYAAESWRGQKPNHDVIDADSGEVIFKGHEKISPRLANKAAKDGLKNVLIPTEEIFGRFSAYDLINEKTGEIYIEAGDGDSEL